MYHKPKTLHGLCAWVASIATILMPLSMWVLIGQSYEFGSTVAIIVIHVVAYALSLTVAVEMICCEQWERVTMTCQTVRHECFTIRRMRPRPKIRTSPRPSSTDTRS